LLQVGQNPPTTIDLLQQILAMQAQQAQDLAQIKATMRPTPATQPAIITQHYHLAALATMQGATGRQLVTPTRPISAQLAQYTLMTGSAGAARISFGAVAEQYQRRKAAAFQEFSSWYVPMAEALGVQRSPYAALPEEVVLYHHSHWIPRHGETLLGGRTWPAPGTLTSNFSLLSAIFEAQGRTGNYSAETQVRAAWLHAPDLRHAVIKLPGTHADGQPCEEQGGG